MVQAYKYPGVEPCVPKDYTGTWRAWQRNGKMAMETDFRDGQMCGESFYWIEDRSLEKYNYRNGQRNGKFIRWNKKGQKTFEANYLNDKFHGSVKGWDENGRKEFERKYYYNGLFSGAETSWNTDGDLKRREYFRNNVFLFSMNSEELKSECFQAWTCISDGVFIVLHNIREGCMFNSSDKPFDKPKLVFTFISENGSERKVESDNFLGMLNPGDYKGWGLKNRNLLRLINFKPFEAVSAWVETGSSKIEMKKELPLGQILEKLNMPEQPPKPVRDLPSRPAAESMLPALMISLFIIIVLSTILTLLLEKIKDKIRSAYSSGALLRSPCLWALTALSIFFVATVLIFTFGNPQWNKYIYLYQAFFYPKYVNGKIPVPAGYTGIWRRWNWSGDIIEESSYKKGRLHGKHLSWNPWSKVRTEVQYENGNKTGTFTVWHSNGKKYSQQSYTPNDKKWRTWYERGMKSSEYVYVDDKNINVLTEWDQDGNITRRCIYDENGQELFYQNAEDAKTGGINSWACSFDGLLIISRPGLFVGKGRISFPGLIALNTANKPFKIKSLYLKGINRYGMKAELKAIDLPDFIPPHAYSFLNQNDVRFRWDWEYKTSAYGRRYAALKAVINGNEVDMIWKNIPLDELERYFGIKKVK